MAYEASFMEQTEFAPADLAPEVLSREVFHLLERVIELDDWPLFACKTRMGVPMLR